MSEPNVKGTTFERILQAALNEFASKGFDGANINKIARDANVTKQLVHHYFQTKEHLYRVTLDLVSEGMEVWLDTDLFLELSAPDAMKLIINRIIDDYIRHPAYATLSLDQALHQGAHITERSRFISKMRARIEEIVKPILERGIASGEFRAGLDAGLVYWLIFHIVSGCFINGNVMTQTLDTDFNSAAGIEIWRAASIDFILNALRKN